MSEIRFNKLFLSAYYVKQGGPIQPLPPAPGGGGDNYGVPSMPLITEPSDTEPPNPQQRLERHKLAVASYIEQQLLLNPGFVGPITVNTEKYGYTAGGFPWQDNLQAAGEIGRFIKATWPQVRIGFYGPAPRKDFFQQAGDTGSAIVPARAVLYREGIKAAANYLKEFADFFVIDGYVPWKRPASVTEDDELPGYLRRPGMSEKITDYYYARYPRVIDEVSITSPGFGGVTWLDDYELSLAQQIDVLAEVAPTKPFHVWVGSAFLPNGLVLNDRVSSPDATWQPPIWQMLMRENTFREVLRKIAKWNPEAVILLEGFSDEKQAVVDYFRRERRLGPPITNPQEPGDVLWRTGGGQGALLWNDQGVSPTVHPYLGAVVEDFKPVI